MAMESLVLANKTLVQLLVCCSGYYKAAAVAFYKQASISGSVAIRLGKKRKMMRFAPLCFFKSKSRQRLYAR